MIAHPAYRALHNLDDALFVMAALLRFSVYTEGWRREAGAVINKVAVKHCTARPRVPGWTREIVARLKKKTMVGDFFAVVTRKCRVHAEGLSYSGAVNVYSQCGSDDSYIGYR